MNTRDLDERFRNRHGQPQAGQAYAERAPSSQYGAQASGYDDSRQQTQWRERDRQAGGGYGQGSLAPDGELRARPAYRSEDARLQSPARPSRGDRATIARSEEQPVYPIRDYDAGYGEEFTDFTSEDYGGRDFYASRRAMGGGSPSYSYRPSYGPSYGGNLLRGEWFGSAADSNDEGYGSWRRYGEERGFLARAGDEIASWFGNDDAQRRREEDHRGRGPSDYVRSDERIREDANDALTHDRAVDARRLTLRVADGEVTLDGMVDSRQAKRRAEDIVDAVSGVKHVQNNLRIAQAATAAPSMGN